MKRSSRYRAAVKELHETVDLYLRLILINASSKTLTKSNLKKNIDKDLELHDYERIEMRLQMIKMVIFLKNDMSMKEQSSS